MNQPAGFDDPLESLYTEAMLNSKLKVRRETDPGVKNALDAAAKKMKELYTLPENWERTRGVALIDKETSTLIGNFSEYVHKTVPHTRKLCREHLPISIDAKEVVEGYLGERIERLRGNSWEAEHFLTCPILLDELMVEAPLVQLQIKTRLGAIIRADLAADTQFSAQNGQMVLQLSAGTNIWEACGADTKAVVRKGVL